MSRKIYKYPIEVMDEQSVWMPAGAEILTCQEQFGIMCLWALVDPVEMTSPRTILIMGTGAISIPDSYNVTYIATIQPVEHKGSLVWHIFERIL